MNNVLEYMENTTFAYPDRIALDDGTHTITYSELLRLSKQIAGMIMRLPDYKKGCFVGVMADRDIFTPAMFMGVLYAGCAYVPLDTDMPKERLDTIIKDSGVCCVINSQQVLEHIPYTLKQDSIITGNARYSEIIPIPEGGDNPLYVIYTSGTTGKPKGIIKSHNSMISFIESFSRRYRLGEHEVIGNQTRFCFDASAKDIYLSLGFGATLQIIPTGLFSFPVKLIEYLNKKNVTYICWVPWALSMVSGLGTFEIIKPKTLKKVFFVGELMSVKTVKQWQEALPETNFVNLYGFSEMSGVCCSYDVPKCSDSDMEKILPVGKPFDNARIIIVDGEICVASDSLFTEYINQEVDNDKILYKDEDGKGAIRYYKTGDFGKFDDLGNLIVIGRQDYQIKHMGYRIELEEIEMVAAAHEQVLECGCVYHREKQRIVLFCKFGEKGQAAVLRNYLKQQLPAYMVPKILEVDHIPRSANGKTDRLTLLKML